MTAENSQAVDSVAAEADVILNISHNMETDDSTVAEPDVPSNRPDDATAAEAAMPSNRIRHALHHSNLLCLAGFGNQEGKIEMWNLTGQRSIISKCQAPATTNMFAWSADGMHFITATATPGLRIGNRYQQCSILVFTAHDYLQTSVVLLRLGLTIVPWHRRPLRQTRVPPFERYKILKKNSKVSYFLTLFPHYGHFKMSLHGVLTACTSLQQPLCLS